MILLQPRYGRFSFRLFKVLIVLPGILVALCFSRRYTRALI